MLGVAAPSLAHVLWPLTGLAGVIAAGALALGGWVRTRTLARAMSPLEAAMRALERGEPARMIAPQQPAVAALAERFNTMAVAVEERERVLIQLAASDPETGLPDRRALEAELTALAASGEPSVAVAAIGIDRFAELSATIGYERAARILKELAVRLGLKAPAAMVGLLSPGALAMVFGAGGAKAALALAGDLAAELEGYVAVGEASVQISLTVGVAAAAAAELERAPLVRAAIAMEQARAARRKIGAFDAKAYGDPAANLALTAQMRRALETGQIEVHHQPKYDIRLGRTVGVEALVRWAHPKRGLLSPGVFVRLAETTGQIRALTDYVLARAVADQDALRRAGHELDVSVNITGRLLSDPDFIAHVLAVAGATNGRLWLEVTDAAFADDPALAVRHVAHLADAGVGVCIDDYGAGALSLAHLREIRAEEVKIDKSLILELADVAQNRFLVRGAIELAHGLGMKVVAKGVETSESYALLASMGCDFAQGFLIERPMPLEDLKAFLAEDRAGVRYG